jgi:hypothetical protein
VVRETIGKGAVEVVTEEIEEEIEDEAVEEVEEAEGVSMCFFSLSEEESAVEEGEDEDEEEEEEEDEDEDEEEEEEVARVETEVEAVENIGAVKTGASATDDKQGK